MSNCGCALAAPAPPAAPVFGDAFWKYWGDGRGELAGYDLTFPRYGSLRKGMAVTVFVTETFSNSLRVKSDPGRHPKSDEFPVMKLNLVEDFPTGIYDYNLMTSAFVALAPVNGLPSGAPTKLSFSAQEWCGMAYAHALFGGDGVRCVSHSYFDGEADRDERLDIRGVALAEDALPLWARGFCGPILAPGGTATVPLLGSLEESRLLHQPVAVKKVKLSRPAGTSRVTVPAGSFDTERFVAAVEGGRTWTFAVERAEPHRLVRWEATDGRHAELLASDRLKYWEMHDEGMQSALAKLGLKARGAREP